MAFFEKYSGALFGTLAVVAILLFTPMRGYVNLFVGRSAMLASIGLAIWLACRLLLVGEWRDKAYWEKNGFITAGAVFLFGVFFVFAMVLPDPPHINTGPCRVSRYESC